MAAVNPYDFSGVRQEGGALVFDRKDGGEPLWLIGDLPESQRLASAVQGRPMDELPATAPQVPRPAGLTDPSRAALALGPGTRTPIGAPVATDARPPVPDLGVTTDGAPVAAVRPAEQLPPESIRRPQPEAPSPWGPRWSHTTPERDQRTGFVVKPGFVKSEDVRAAESDLSIDRKLAAQTAGDVALKEEGLDLAAQEREIANARAEQDAQRKRQIDIQTEAKRLAEESRRRVQELGSGEVDPNRIFQNSPARTALAAIASAMGAYSAGMLGGENHASKVIQNAIDRDIAAQRDSFRQRGEKAERARGAYADFIALHGSPEQAEREMQMIGTRIAAMELHKSKSGIRSQKILAGVDATINDLEQRAIELQAEQEREIQGDVTEQYQWIPQRTVSGGGPPTLEQQLKMLELQGKTLEANEKIRRLMSGDISGEFAPGTEGAKSLERYGKAQNNVALHGANMRELQDQIFAATGGDPKGDIPGVGGAHMVVPESVSYLFSGDQGRKIQRSVKAAAESALRLATGAAAPTEEKEAYKALIEGRWGSDAELRYGLEMMGRRLKDSQENIDRSYPPAVREYYHRNTPTSEGWSPTSTNVDGFVPVRR